MAHEKKELKIDTPVTSFPKSKIEILLLENVSQRAVNYLVNEGFSVETRKTLTEEELGLKISTVHAIGIRSKTKLPQNVLEKAKRLLCIGHFCIGTDQTDLNFSKHMGVPVFNSPFANTRSVAELVLANIICLARKAGDQNRWLHQGLWKKSASGCYEVRGKTLGIIGYGHVGSQLSVLAEALGLVIIYYDVVPKLPLGNAKPVSSMEQVLQTADFVSLHVPYTKDTERLIGEKQVNCMKKGAYLLNAARGKCVDIQAVARALRSGHLGGAYFDVYPTEPAGPDLCLSHCPNTILSPHIGGSTLEAQDAIGVEVAAKMARFINEGLTTASVNFPNIQVEKNQHVHRILHVHKNVPGVLKKVNDILCDYNVSTQVLKSSDDVAYMLVELDPNRHLSMTLKQQFDDLQETIKTRILYAPGCH